MEEILQQKKIKRENNGKVCILSERVKFYRNKKKKIPKTVF